MESLENQLLEAFRIRDWERAMGIIQIAKEAERLELEELEVKQRREQFEGRVENFKKGPPPADWVGRKIPLQVTEGAKAYSYLLVTKALKEKSLVPEETLTIHVKATGETFTTTIYARNKVLMEKHAIGRFYDTAGVTPGDIVLLEEIAPKEWNLTKTPHRSFVYFALEGIKARMSQYGMGRGNKKM